MLKTYRYKNLSASVGDQEDALFTVDFISDGNAGDTTIDVPGPLDRLIENQGTTSLGKGQSLRSTPSISVSVLSNLVPLEDEIRIRYSINGQLLVEHANSKAEADQAIIILQIKFPAI